MNNIETLLFVEGPNDKGFIIAFVKLKLPKLFDTIKVINMAGIANFANSLKSNEPDIKNKRIKNVGFIIDLDDKTTLEKIDSVNTVFKEINLLREYSFDERLKFNLPLNENRTVNFSLFLMQNSTNQGELIDLLKEIKLNSAATADCIIACISQKEDSAKVMADDWLHFYLKWDSSTKKQREVSNKIGLDKTETMERLDKIFDLNSENIMFQNLKKYLEFFTT